MNLSKLEIENAPPIYFRKGTSDEELIHKNTGSESEYIFPEQAEPKVIFDIGANIGIISLVMTNLYPDAIIHAFEPVPTNYDILLRNIEEYPNIHPHFFALGSSEENKSISHSDNPKNFGGYSFHKAGTNHMLNEMVKVRETYDAIREFSHGRIGI